MTSCDTKLTIADGSRKVSVSSVKPRHLPVEEIIEMESSDKPTVLSNEPTDTLKMPIASSNDSTVTLNDQVTTANDELDTSVPTDPMDTSPITDTTGKSVIVTENCQATGESQPSEKDEDDEDGPYYTDCYSDSETPWE